MIINMRCKFKTKMKIRFNLSIKNLVNSESTTIMTEEWAALIAVSAIVDDACDATPVVLDEDAFISTGWPERIQSVAKAARGLMCERGRFNEDHE